MISKDEFAELVNNLKGKLDDTTSALVSEELLATISAYNTGFDEYEESRQEVEKLKTDKEELLKTNGKLFQKIGFDKEDEKSEDEKKEEVEKIKIEDVIDEKGELI